MGERHRNVQFTYTSDGSKLDLSHSGQIGVRGNPRNNQACVFNDVNQNIRDEEHNRESLQAQLQTANAEFQREKQELRNKQDIQSKLEVFVLFSIFVLVLKKLCPVSPRWASAPRSCRSSATASASYKTSSRQ